MLMVALTTFLFSMGELWGRNADVHLFDQHVNAVTRFLANQMRAATFPPAAKANATPVTVVQVTPAHGLTDYLITFDLIAGNRILTWPDWPLPEVVCSCRAGAGQPGAVSALALPARDPLCHLTRRGNSS